MYRRRLRSPRSRRSRLPFDDEARLLLSKERLHSREQPLLIFILERALERLGEIGRERNRVGIALVRILAQRSHDHSLHRGRKAEPGPSLIERNRRLRE